MRAIKDEKLKRSIVSTVSRILAKNEKCINDGTIFKTKKYRVLFLSKDGPRAYDFEVTDLQTKNKYSVTGFEDWIGEKVSWSVYQ